jgi:hypothetical protein
MNLACALSLYLKFWYFCEGANGTEGQGITCTQNTKFYILIVSQQILKLDFPN